jgi:hypothetical protein
VNGVVENNARSQDKTKRRRKESNAKQGNLTQHKTKQADLPDGARRDLTRRNWSFASMLPVEFDIERVVQVHTSDVQKTHARNEKWQ